MTPQEFVANFSTLTDAPGGIKKLRELVLELAVSGRLGTTEPHDETADAVLAEVGRRIGRQVGNGVEPPADTPASWKWVRLQDLVVFGPKNGYSPKPVEYETGVKALTLTATTSGRFDGARYKYIDEEIPRDSHLWLNPGDILVQRGNTIDYVGTAAVFDGPPDKYIYPDLMMKIRVAAPLDTRYIHLAMGASSAREFLRARATGTSGSMPKISQSVLVSLPLPIPPAAEQKRIVAKVDQLMALLDDLEAKQTKRQHTVTRATTACLDALTTADSPEEVAAAWKRVAGNWRVLFDRPEAVGELRGVVRDLGCNGNLTNPKRFDITGTGQELLSDLLRRRRLTRARLMGQKAGGRQLPAEARIDPSGFAATLHVPNSWDVCGLDDLAACKPNALKAGPFGSALTKQMYVAKGYKVYGQEQVISGDHTVGHYYISPDKFESLKSCAIAPGDILISLMGTIGRVLILPDDCSPGIINPRLLKLSLDPGLFAPFVKLYLESPRARRIMGELAHGIAMDNLNLGTLRVVPFPLPPLEEQRSIVAKVDQLMAACDALESALRRRDDRAGRLVAAVVGEVTAG